ncbi:GT2D2 protein, partial [Amia calva]|nr:GT2D2 protein [Amia calva]
MSKKRKIDKEGIVFQERWEWEYLFVEQSLKRACLVCKESLAVMKEFTIRQHYETKHKEKCGSLEREQRLDKVAELKKKKLQQTMFKRAKTESNAADKASYIVSQDIAKTSRSFSEGAFLKDLSCSGRRLHLIRDRGLNHHRFQVFLEELNVECGDLSDHTEVRWLSGGVVLTRVFELRGEIRLFLQNKGRQRSKLSDESWLCELAFLFDVTEHLNTLNMKLTGSTQVITEMYDSVKAFQLKLSLWEKQMQQGNIFHFQTGIYTPY